MVGEHSVGQAVDGEYAGEKLQPLSNPGSPVLERLACRSVPAAQKCAAHATLDGMHHLDFVGVEILTSSLSGHSGSSRDDGEFMRCWTDVSGVQHRHSHSKHPLVNEFFLKVGVPFVALKVGVPFVASPLLLCWKENRSAQPEFVSKHVLEWCQVV